MAAKQEIVVWKWRNPYEANKTTVREQEVHIGPHRLVVLQNGEPGARLLGEVLWDGAYLLSRILADFHRHHSIHLHGAQVVELGSGTGLVGMACAALGANVVLTDIEDILPRLSANVEHNRQAVAAGSMQVQRLLWGDAEDIARCVALAPDFLMCADVLYGTDRPVHRLLLQTIEAFSAAGAEVFFAYKPRYPAHEAWFFHKARKVLDLEEVPRYLYPEDFGPCSDYTVYRMRAKPVSAA